MQQPSPSDYFSPRDEAASARRPESGGHSQPSPTTNGRSVPGRIDTPRGGESGAAQLGEIEQVLAHFEQLEAQFQKVREGLTHSHRLATLGTIASVIAHEYNNILTPIISYAQLALASPDDHEAMRKAVEKALSGAERAANISSSLLGFAREQDHEHVAKVRTVIEEAIACLGRRPEKDGINLVVDVPDVTVAMSPLNLQQVLLNLALNARKAMRRHGGRLRLTGRVEGQDVVLEVSDTGPGISPQVMDRLFEPFVTHTPASEGESEGSTVFPESPRQGTGLGLCICRDLLRSAGGTIRASSVPGQGATFTMTIPLAAAVFEST